MELTIRKNKGDARDVKLIREAVPFMLNRLLAPEHVKAVTLNISFTALRGDFGDIGIEAAPVFKLRLHPEMDTLLMLLTLAHELVHLAQVMDGRLTLKEINDLTHWHWNGEAFGSDPYGQAGHILPWESDAERHEGGLARQFFNHYVTSLNPN